MLAYTYIYLFYLLGLSGVFLFDFEKKLKRFVCEFFIIIKIIIQGKKGVVVINLEISLVNSIAVPIDVGQDVFERCILCKWKIFKKSVYSLRNLFLWPDFFLQETNAGCF